MKTTEVGAGDLSATVDGFVAPGFEPVRDAFATHLAQGREEGAAVCAYVEGRPVVDLWGGYRDRGAGAVWQDDTVGLVFSATKGLTAIAALHLASRGLLDLDAPVAEYWPEFGANGKEAIPVRLLLTHQVGLPGFTRLMTLADMAAWDPLVEDLAKQRPAWEPGTAHGYHAFTFGWLVGEVVRRISGLTPGQYLREQLCGPLGLDIWFGLPADQRHRYARITQQFNREDDPEAAASYQALMDDLAGFSGKRAMTDRGIRLGNKLLSSPLRPQIEKATARKIVKRELTDAQRAFSTLLVTVDDLASDKTLDTEFPAGNAICTARSLARIYSALIGPVESEALTEGPRQPQILSDPLVTDASTRHAFGQDRVLHMPTAFGLGFMVPGSTQAHGWGGGAFGHPGNGGALGFADPVRGLSFGYVRKQITQLVRNSTTENLVSAVYACA